jgi:hypothetical protein
VVAKLGLPTVAASHCWGGQLFDSSNQPQIGMLFLTDPYVLTGAENALSPSVRLQQYTSAPKGQQTTAATAQTTRPNVGPRILHL